MADYSYSVVVDVDATGAIGNLDDIKNTVEKSNTNLLAMRNELKAVKSELLGLEPGTKEFDRLAKKAGELKDRMNDVSEAVTANAGPAFESIGNQAGQLKDRFMNLDLKGVGESFAGIGGSIKKVNIKDLQEQIGGLGKGLAALGKSLLTNPIFLIGAAIAAIIVNFKEITKLFDGVTGAQEDLLAAQEAGAKASKEALDSISQQENILRMQGKTEKEIVQLKIKAVDAAILAQKTVIETNKNILTGQIEAAKRNREFVNSLLLFMTAPLQLVLSVYDKVTGSDTQAKFNDFVSGLIFDPAKVEEEGLAALAEQEKQLKALENQQAGFILSVQKMDADAAQKSKDQRQKASDERLAADEKEKAALLKSAEEVHDLVAELEALTIKEMEEAANKKKQIAFNENQERLKGIEDTYFVEQELLKQKLGAEKEIELDALNLKYEALYEKAGENTQKEKEITEARNSEVAAIDKKYADQARSDQQKIIDEKLKAIESGFALIGNLNNSFTAKTKKQAKAQFEINKAVSIASAIMDTYKAAASAFAAGAKFGPIVGAAYAGIAVVAGLLNVNKIRQTKFEGGGGGGGGASAGGDGGGGGSLSGGGGGGTSSTTPTFNPLDNQFLNNRPPQVQAFVLAGSAQTEEERRQKIEDLSRLN